MTRAATATKTTKAKPAAAPEPVPRLIQAIPLKDIVVSPFEPQARRRARFTAEEKQGMAESLRINGQLQDIKVRPVGKKFEIVYGELRFLGHQINKAPTINSIVEELDDEAAFHQQTEENDNRKEPHPMDQAANYEFHKKLLEEKRGNPITIEELAEIVGKPVKHVAGRLKLNGLILEAQVDVEEGFLPLGHAMEMAKYSPEAQKVIYSQLYEEETEWDPKKGKWEVVSYLKSELQMSLSELTEWIKGKILLRLAEAPFDKKATDLREDGLACINCPQRTGANASLFEKGELGKNDSCLNPTCYNAKCEQLIETRRHEVAADKEIDVDKVPLVSTHNWEDGDGFLGRKSFTQIGGISGTSEIWCEHEESAVNVSSNAHTDPFAAIVQICRELSCKTHKPEPKGSSGGVSISAGSSSKKGQSQEERDEVATLERRKRREELFDVKVGQEVRHRVFKAAAEKFGEHVDGFEVASIMDLTPIVVRLWKRSEHPSNILPGIIAKEWGIDLSYSVRNGQDEFAQIAALTEEQRARLLFLYTFSHEGAMYGNGYVSQAKVRAIAEKWGLDYQMLDAVERMNAAPMKHKQRFRDYIQKLEEGDKKAILPRHITDKYKPRD